jgi:chromosome segregation ATPase
MILRCFDIHVDNPCCILTQEESKKFIQGGEADKYEFFLKATGLQTLKDDLVEITATLDETTIRRSQNDKAIKDKDKSVQRLKEQYESIKNFENIEREVEECWVKLLWHDHLIAEATFEQMKQEVAEKEKASSEVNANFQKTLRMRDGVEDEIDRHNAEISRIQTLQAELESEYKQKQVDVTTTSRALTAKREAVKQLTKVQNEYRERLTDVSRQVSFHSTIYFVLATFMVICISTA